jgi:hypothetical protein
MKKLPEIFVNNINKKISHNDEVYYSYKDNNTNDEIIKKKYSLNEMQNIINDLFKSNDFIYKKKFYIKTTNMEGDFIIISKSYDYLLTIDGERIYIDNILEID